LTLPPRLRIVNRKKGDDYLTEMDSKELLPIKITRVVNAPRWRVIRMLTKVWELSGAIPTISEVKVIAKSRNTVKTKWRILVNDLPINWIEEDTLDLGQNTIHFKAIEGDLSEFRGTWQFRDHPQGTEVAVEIYIHVGIPAIEDFAEEYVNGLVTKIFETILETLEHRLISQRYMSFRKGNIDKVAGFGLIGHFYNLNHLSQGLKMLRPDFHDPSAEFLGKLFDIAPSFKVSEMKEYRSGSGQAVTSGCVILCTFVPDMIADNHRAVYAKVVRACKLAEKSGVGIVTLGGFTSIVAERFGGKIREEVDIPVTTGNTYTAALAVEGVEKAAQLLEKDMKDLKVTVVGGTGDIGSACALALSQKTRQVTITGRTKMNLYLLYYELWKKRKSKIYISTNNKKAVKDADIVIAAANASASILQMEWFKPGAIVCDLAYPKNLSYKTRRKDILVFSGGLAAVPSPIDVGVMMGLPSPNVCYGCSCEAIILALERRFENFSFGRGNITLEKMEEIRKMGIKHGFDLAPFFWADGMVQKEDLEVIKRASLHV